MGVVLFLVGAIGDPGRVAAIDRIQPPAAPVSWMQVFSPDILMGSLALLAFSAFFSSSEVAFYSLHQLRLRSMRRSARWLDRLVARLMDHPGSLLTTILMGNCIVNVLLGVLLGARIEMGFQAKLPLPHVVSYALAVVASTAVLVSFGEIAPKLLVVRNGEAFAHYAAVPIYLADRLLMPLRGALLVFVGFLFRVTRFSQVRPAPFMTDDEFKALLSEGEASGVIEEDERQMIQGILEFSDCMVKEVLVPRPDMIVLPEEATVGQALALVREHEFARIPVYKGDLDSITGVLFAKDLLPSVVRGDLRKPIRPMIRKARFVPETMSVSDFVKAAQRLRTHLVIAVDEFGGTEGLVTLQDALREVIGDIGEEDEAEGPLYTNLGGGEYRLDGSFPLDELDRLTGVPVQDGEHTTVAGFLMEQSDRILEVGDEIQHAGVLYTIEEVEGKRVSRLRLKVLDAKSPPSEEEEAKSP